MRRRAMLVVGAAILLASGGVFFISGVRENLVVVGPGLTNRLGNGVGTDFTAFYAAARLARGGHASDIYKLDALSRAQELVRGVPIKRKYAWAYPPTVLLLLLPLSWLPAVAAMWAWLVATTVVASAAATCVLRTKIAPILVLLFPGIALAWVTGPTGTLSAATAMLGFSLLHASPLTAGLVLGLLSVKPHLAILVPVCLLAGRYRLAIAGFGLSATGLVIASTLLFGFDLWSQLEPALRRHLMYVQTEQIPWMRMPTPFVAVHHATGSEPLAWCAQLATAASCLCISAWVWFRSSDDFARALVLCASIPLMSPYAYDYDTSVLLVPLAYGLRGALTTGVIRASDAGTLVLLWLSPIAIWLGSAALGQQIGPLLLGTLVYGGLLRGYLNSRQHASGLGLWRAPARA